MTHEMDSTRLEDDTIELTVPEQWERVNDLLMLITTILLFNVTSLFIAVSYITWNQDTIVVNEIQSLKPHRTIGMYYLSIQSH